MYATYLFKCNKCEAAISERFIEKDKVEDQKCYYCGDKIKRLLSPTKTHFKFNDTKLKK